MRAGLVVMMVAAGGSLGVGATTMEAGLVAPGAATVLVSIAVAVYAFVKGSKEDEAQREYDLRYLERIDAFKREVAS